MKEIAEIFGCTESRISQRIKMVVGGIREKFIDRHRGVA